jgi:DNA-binding NarL/FixJ family response regulator
MPSTWIIEDNPAFRDAIAAALSGRPGFAELAAFERCEDALAALETKPAPVVFLLDVALPGMDGIQGIAALRKLCPNTIILMLTVFEDDDKIFRAVCAGASGYLLKSMPIASIVTAIEEAVQGGSPMNPRVARRVLEMFARLAPPKEEHGLTAREEEVIRLMFDGLAKKQIADALRLNPHTVDYTIRCIYRKLHVNCQSAAMSKAIKIGLVTRAR